MNKIYNTHGKVQKLIYPSIAPTYALPAKFPSLSLSLWNARHFTHFDPVTFHYQTFHNDSFLWCVCDVLSLPQCSSESSVSAMWPALNLFYHMHTSFWSNTFINL